MTRITEKQKGVILRLFQDGTALASIAIGYGVEVKRIEDIVRTVLKQGEDHERRRLELVQARTTGAASETAPNSH